MSGARAGAGRQGHGCAAAARPRRDAPGCPHATVHEPIAERRLQCSARAASSVQRSGRETCTPALVVAGRRESASGRPPAVPLAKRVPGPEPKRTPATVRHAQPARYPQRSPGRQPHQPDSRRRPALARVRGACEAVRGARALRHALLSTLRRLRRAHVHGPARAWRARRARGSGHARALERVARSAREEGPSWLRRRAERRSTPRRARRHVPARVHAISRYGERERGAPSAMRRSNVGRRLTPTHQNARVPARWWPYGAGRCEPQRPLRTRSARPRILQK